MVASLAMTSSSLVRPVLEDESLDESPLGFASLRRIDDRPLFLIVSTESFTNGCYTSHPFTRSHIHQLVHGSSFLHVSHQTLADEINERVRPFRRGERRSGTQANLLHRLSDKPSYGFFPCANSISETPSDHTSLLNSAFLLNTSGALYHMVSHELRCFLQQCSIRSAKPKSPNLISPLPERNRLVGLMFYALNSHSNTLLCE